MLNNKTIYDAMTIKLTAEDIPMEIPKLDPSIRRAPKRIVKLSDHDIELALRNALRYIPEEFHEMLAPELLLMEKQDKFVKTGCNTDLLKNILKI